MNHFAVFVPAYTRRSQDTYFNLTFKIIAIIPAYSATHALRLAKKAGYPAPIIGPTKETLQ
jgi:hypothetical protein